MMKRAWPLSASLILAVALLLSPAILRAAPGTQEVGVVVMHGKGGRPDRLVNALSEALEKEGFLVASLEMPWSARRNYDVDLETGIGEVSKALDGLRARGAKKLFVSGHSQGGLFSVIYGGRHKVDGVVAIVPGGAVDTRVYATNVGTHVARARQMVADGRGGETADFADYEGSKGSIPVTTTAAIYFSWFDPAGSQTNRAFREVKVGVPVLYVSATRDYPGMLKFRDKLFAEVPAHPLKRMPVIESDHLNAPGAAAPEMIRWIREVVGQ